MPLFVLHAIDRPDVLPLRLEHYAAHRAFIETEAEHGITILLSGPLQSDDGEMMTGSLFIIDAPDRATIEAFVQADPFTKNEVWGHVSITRFHKRKG
jgi:uncharacterized protein YciI